MTYRLSFPVMLLLLLIGSCCWTAATDIQPEQVVAEITTESLTTDLPTTTILPTTIASFTTSTKTRISGPRRRLSTVTPSATAVIRLETSTALPIEQPITDQSRARILLGSEDDPNVLSVSPIVPPTSNSNDWTPIVRPTTRLASEASSISAVQQSASTSSSSSTTLLIRPTPLLRPLPTIVAAPARVGTQPSLRTNNSTTGRPIGRPVVSNSPATPSVVRFNIEDAGLPPNPNLADSAASPSAFPDDTIFFSPQFDDGNLTDNSAVLGAPVQANPAQSTSSTTAAASLAKLSGPFGNRIVRNRTTTLPPATPTPPPSVALSSGLSAKADEPLANVGPSVLVTISPEDGLEGNSTEVPTLSGDSTLTWTDDIPLVNENRATEVPSEPEITTIIDLPSETSNAGSTTEATVSVTDPKTSIASIRTRPPRPTTTQQTTTTTTGKRRRPPTTEAAPVTAANSESPAPLSSTELSTPTTSAVVETTERDSARTLQTTTLAGPSSPITLFPAKTRPPSSTHSPIATVKVKPAEEQPMTTIGWQTIPTTTFSNVPAVISHSSTTTGVHDVSHQTVRPLTSFTEPLTTIRAPSTFMPPSTTTTTDHSFPLGSGDWPSTEETSTLSEKDSTTIIAVSVSIAVVLCIALLLLLFLVLRRRRARAVQGTCQPARMDAYSLDNVSQTNTWQRNKGRSTLRSSKRSYLNQGFDDSTIFSVPLTAAQLALYMEKAITSIEAEFRNVATTSTVRLEELPPGVETKNRYANVLPIPETRVHIRVQDNQPQDTPEQYINANYIKGPKDEARYYIACQGPMEETVEDFWQMIWENQTKIIIQLTDLTENNVARCAEYLPPSEVLDCHRLYGDYQVTLKSRELRDNYVVSHVQLKRMEDNLVRDITHLWYSSWPATGVPEDAKTVVALLLEARKGQSKEHQHPLVIHCSPGTGRTGAVLAIDVCLRHLDTSRSIDIPRCVHRLRQDRSGCVQTGEQYAFIYRAVNYYASQLSNAALDSL